MRDLFRRAGFETPELDARLLAELAFGLDRLTLVTREREQAEPAALHRFQELAARRLRGEPVDRIIGEKEFWGLRFKLSAATLVPRPETELVVERALAALEGRHHKRILDLGTGTGCIAIAILSASPSASAVAIDLSPDAVAMARENAERLGVAKRLDVRQGSWFDPLDAGDRFDLVVSNPPYIERGTIETLQPEVRDHDPRLALDGGNDGLEAYRAILGGVATWLKPDGALVVEIGATQGPAVAALFGAAGLHGVVVESDLAGLDRVVSGSHS